MSGGFFYSFGEVGFNKKDSFKRNFLNCIIIIFVVCGTFAVSEYAENRYAETSVNMFSTEGIPVSFEDFGVKSENVENKGTVESTRFGQLYRFESRVDSRHDEEGSDGFLIYQILVSDYPVVIQKFIDKIFKEHNDFDCELVQVTLTEAEWDYCYKGKFTNGNMYDVFAVKDNVVVYIIISEQYEKEFFDVAYKKLFIE